MSISGSIDSKKLVETLLGDLRLLSTESKKKHNHVKEAAESGVVRIRNISTASADHSLLANLRTACTELLHPLVLACATRYTRLVQIALQGIQKLIQHRILTSSGSSIVVNELWALVEDGCEELRVLQTVPPLVSSDLIVTGNTLAKCIVMCFRLHFAKDIIVINTASAAVRQLICGVFERVIQEDGIFSSEMKVVPPTGGRPSPRAAPPTLRPCAADAYMLFKDICLLVNGEPPVWLVGIQEMTRTFGLELLESLLKGFPSVFIRHTEFGDLLKNDVCPLIIRLFSPNVKSVNAQQSNGRPTSSSANDRPNFQIFMRLVRIVTLLVTFYHKILTTECEIFISTLLKFIDGDRKGWHRPLALESLHRIVAQADIIRWLCETFDMVPESMNMVKSISSALENIISESLLGNTTPTEDDMDRSQEDVGPGFLHRGHWIPFVEQLTPKKSLMLDSLDRIEPMVLPDGYILSRACGAVCDLAQSVYVSTDALCLPDENEQTPNENLLVAKVLYKHSQPDLLSSVGILLQSSCDEILTDTLLRCLSTLISVGARVNEERELHQCFFVLSSMSLPLPSYLTQYAGIRSPFENSVPYLDSDGWSSTPQVLATGPPCPCPVVPTELWNRQVFLTAKNVQASKALLSSISAHVGSIHSLWYLCLISCQHLTWLLNMRPTQIGLFTRETREDSQGSSQVTVTTAALSDIAILAAVVDKLAPKCVEMNDEKLLEVVEALIRLSDENLAVAATGRECSQFPLAVLLRTTSLGLSRLTFLWAKVSAHFIKVCNHTSIPLRDWAAVGLTSLVKQAMKIKTDMEIQAQQEMIIGSLMSLCSIPHTQVRRRQLDSVMAMLQSEGAQLLPSLWPTVIHIVSAVLDNETCGELSLVRQGYLGLRLISSDFLQSVPFSSISSLVEAISRYSKQTTEQNISLSALTLLWTISDFIYRKMEAEGADASEAIWTVLYTCLSESCVDARFAVRKSACQTLLQTVMAHGHALRPVAWDRMIWQIITPLLDKVKSQTKSASTEKTSGDLIIHHSRDTEQKQWTETCNHTLSAISKIFICQRKSLLALGDFGDVWKALLSYLEWAACYENAELSLSAIRSYQEVLLGKVSAQTLSINMNDRNSVSEFLDASPPDLPLAQWEDSWQAWLRIARGLSKRGLSGSLSASKLDATALRPVYTPGPSHITALLHIFPPLFEKVSKTIAVQDLKYDCLPTILESLSTVPLPSEQAPYVQPSSSTSLTPTQEALLDAVKIIYVECTLSGTTLREVISDQIRLLLRFASMATVRNLKKQPPGGFKTFRDYALALIVPFSEYSLRMAIEFYTSTASYPELTESLVVNQIIKFLGEPLHLKYTCISPTTWKLAASSLLTVMKTSIPIARQNLECFSSFWAVLCDTIEKYLFSPNGFDRLAADERKRDELVECQVIDLIRTEILPHASKLPQDDVQRIIGLLHKGSVSQLDPTDVLASDSHTQRTELAKVCFDALLSTSSGEDDEQLRHVAVTSLLKRCEQVMEEFMRDWSTSGDLRLPRSRIGEMVAALQAIDSLISRLARDPTMRQLHSQLVSLFPKVVDVFPCCRADQQLQSQLIKTMKSFQTLMFLTSMQ